jgi:uncharacterized protein YndB with AHSA1/START domain
MTDLSTMTKLSTAFEKTIVTRVYPASPQRVFAALSDRTAMEAWASPGDNFALRIDPFEFREGGRALSHMTTEGEAPWINDETYQNIVPAQRIITTSSLRHKGNLCFAGVIVYELAAEGAGTRLTITELGVFPDGHDSAEMHQMGWTQMLDQLGAWLSR